MSEITKNVRRWVVDGTGDRSIETMKLLMRLQVYVYVL